MINFKLLLGATAIAFTAAPKAIAHENGATIETIVGAASWYGPGFHGRQTASGEVFDMGELTAAHRTLPFGTRTRVTNEANGKSVIVRINDRGPFSGNRKIDLSREAARSIGLIDAGVGQVKIEVLQRA